MSQLSEEHEAFDLIRKNVDEGMFDPSAQQQAAQPEPAQEAAPQGPQAMDFAGQQGADVQQQAAPEPAPEPQQPQQPAMQFPQQSTANSTLNAYHQNVANADQQYQQGMAQQQQALQQKEAIAEQNNDAVSQQLQQQQLVDQQYQGVRNGLDEHLANITQRSVAKMEQDVSQQEQLLNENPHDFWGGSSTVNKIGAVIGMIGAGLHGDNAAQYMQNIVNNRVAENQRKQQALSHLQRSRQKMLSNEQQMHTDQIANIDAQKAAAYKYIENQMKQRVQLTANATERANLTAEIGKLQTLAADHTTKGADDLVKNDLNGVRTRLGEEHLALEKQEQMQAQQAAAQPKPQEDPNKYLQSGAFEGRGFQAPVYEKATARLSSSENFVGLVNQDRKLLKHLTPENILQVKQVNAQMLSELRQLQQTGANLSPEEVKNIEALTPALSQVINGKLGVADFDKMLTNAQRLITNSALGYARNVGAPENQLRQTSPLYGVRKAQDDEEAGQQQEASDQERARAILDKATAAR